MELVVGVPDWDAVPVRLAVLHAVAVRVCDAVPVELLETLSDAVLLNDVEADAVLELERVTLAEPVYMPMQWAMGSQMVSSRR